MKWKSKGSESMKISVAMATYNGMSYIEEQLDSLRLQFRLPDEVIICDDASSDGTADFVDEYIEKHSLFGWKLHRNTENMGFKKNFLSAISKTDGDIIFLCDQDDTWYKNKTEIMSRIMEENPQILSLSSSFDFVDEAGEHLSDESAENTSNHGLVYGKINENCLAPISLKAVMHSNISPGCTTVIRKELKDSFCRNSNSVLPHDWELNLVAASKDGLYFLNRKLSGYRIHSSNTLGLDSAPKGRTEVAKEKLSAAETLCRYADFTRLLAMQQNRVTALCDKSLFKTIKLFFTSIEYARYYSLKERIGDIIFTLRNK